MRPVAQNGSELPLSGEFLEKKVCTQSLMLLTIALLIFLWFLITLSFVFDYQHLCSSPCLLIYLSVCLSICPVCLSVCLSVYLSRLFVLSVGVLGCDCRILVADFVLSMRRFLLLIIQLAIITTYANNSRMPQKTFLCSNKKQKSHERNKNTKYINLKIIISVLKIFQIIFSLWLLLWILISLLLYCSLHRVS